MTDPVGVAFIGFGRQAEFHARAMAATPDKFRLLAVSDITESRRAAAASLGMRAGRHVADALGADVELVFITSHSSLHFEHTMVAIDAGKHVMVEKPFATTGADARAMVNAARDPEY